jgi:hypothetical protein
MARDIDTLIHALYRHTDHAGELCRYVCSGFGGDLSQVYWDWRSSDELVDTYKTVTCLSCMNVEKHASRDFSTTGRWKR